MMTQIQTGDVFRTELGEEMEITNEKDEKVCIHFPEREGVEGGAYTVWRPRESVEKQVEYEGMEKVEGDESEAQGVPEGDVEWNSTPRCPECSVFMSRDVDGQGFPAAQCSRTGCNGILDVDELIEGDYVEF